MSLSTVMTSPSQYGKYWKRQIISTRCATVRRPGEGGLVLADDRRSFFGNVDGRSTINMTRNNYITRQRKFRCCHGPQAISNYTMDADNDQLFIEMIKSKAIDIYYCMLIDTRAFRQMLGLTWDNVNCSSQVERRVAGTGCS